MTNKNTRDAIYEQEALDLIQELDCSDAASCNVCLQKIVKLLRKRDAAVVSNAYDSAAAAILQATCREIPSSEAVAGLNLAIVYLQAKADKIRSGK